MCVVGIWYYVYMCMSLFVHYEMYLGMHEHDYAARLATTQGTGEQNTEGVWHHFLLKKTWWRYFCSQQISISWISYLAPFSQSVSQLVYK